MPPASDKVVTNFESDIVKLLLSGQPLGGALPPKIQVHYGVVLRATMLMKWKMAPP